MTANPYPPEFIAHVKAAYPGWTELHQSLDSGNPNVASLLQQGTTNHLFMASDIVQAIEGGYDSTQALLMRARRSVQAGQFINDLYQLAFIGPACDSCGKPTRQAEQYYLCDSCGSVNHTLAS